jgi:hypothetical protein
MAAGDVKLQYGSSVDLPVTTLLGLAASATWVIGWSSDEVDNTTNKYEDYLVSGKITTQHDGTVVVGEIRIYVVAMISDTEWPTGINHDETADTWPSTNERDSCAKLAAVIVNHATNNTAYAFGPFSVANLFGGVCPPKFEIFIAHSTSVALDHNAGTQVITHQGVFYNVAAS